MCRPEQEYWNLQLTVSIEQADTTNVYMKKYHERDIEWRTNKICGGLRKEKERESLDREKH